MTRTLTVAILAVVLTSHALQPEPSTPPAPQTAPEHDHGVTARGDHAMGFSHETTTHHFRLYKAGGAIEVLANDPKDSATRGEIRMHLSHIVNRFSEGDFNIPMFIHDTLPPGASTMSRLRKQIHYRYKETPRGATIQITTDNKDAVRAIQAFLRFQISDHHTGDTAEISNQ